METTTLTYGQRLVGLEFNPGGSPEVAQVKEFFAKVIDALDALRNDSNSKEKESIIHSAVMEAVTAQMAAVKAITYKY